MSDPTLTPGEVLEKLFGLFGPLERYFIDKLRAGLTSSERKVREAKAKEIRKNLYDDALEISEDDRNAVDAALEEAVEQGGTEAHVQLILDVADRIDVSSRPSKRPRNRKKKPPISPERHAEMQASTQFEVPDIPDISELIDE